MRAWLRSIFSRQGFQLDPSRIVELDGHEFVIESFYSEASYANTKRITVTFVHPDVYREQYGS